MEGRLYLKVPPVYLVDDVQMTGQQAFEEVNGPALQCLRQDSVIGVRTGPHHNVPGLEITVEGPVTPGETADVRSRVRRQTRTFSQLSFSVSTRIRISSGMARAGWVSFSWMATCGPRPRMQIFLL